LVVAIFLALLAAHGGDLHRHQERGLEDFLHALVAPKSAIERAVVLFTAPQNTRDELPSHT
jgi:hypothetical protein